jgi:hypothetical protein
MVPRDVKVVIEEVEKSPVLVLPVDEVGNHRDVGSTASGWWAESGDSLGTMLSFKVCSISARPADRTPGDVSRVPL